MSITPTLRTSGAVGAGRHEDRNQHSIQIEPARQLMYIHRTRHIIGFASGDLNALNRNFVSLFDELRAKTVENIELTEKDCNDFLRKLRLKGQFAYNKIFPSSAHDWLVELERRAGTRGISLTLEVPPDLRVFWEMLYPRDSAPGSPVVAEQFWGFRYPLGCIYMDIGPFDNWVELESGIFSARHRGLVGAQKEIDDIKTYLQTFCAGMGREFIVQMLDHEPALQALTSLSVDDLLNFFGSDAFDYGILHMACHCEEPENGMPMQDYLSMTVGDRLLDLSVETLEQYAQWEGFMRKPLVFLNACASSTATHLLQTTSMPAGFLKLKAGGVIATACTMPDNFANAFGSYFYGQLLDKTKMNRDEVDIGEALLATRLHFLHKYKNPLGLAYGLYAAPNQKLRIG